MMDPIMSPVRNAVVAGQFYPAFNRDLEHEIEGMLGEGPPRKVLGVMAPHAGYVYSGAVAGAVYASVELPQTFVILGPNHTGVGTPASIMTGGVWRLPGGDAVIDNELAESILSHGHQLMADESAHSYEHSIEVQIPFLQYLAGEINFVPISMMSKSADLCRDVGNAVAAALEGMTGSALIVASSDMTHYESQEDARRKDELALKKMLDLDPEGLLETVSKNGITMCGAAPAAAMLFACKKLGATKATLVSYATSGDVTGDYGQVVGYAGVTVS